MTDLLKILKSNGLIVPEDARCLLKTPRYKIDVRDVSPGKYVHIGVKKNLMILLQNVQASNNDTISLDINIDGLPLSKSSSLCLWPILGSIFGHEDLKPFIIGAYCGNGKPSSVDEFLKEFVDEIMDLTNTPIIFEHKIIKVKIRTFCCDAPAKSFACGVMGHQSFNGCTKCIQIGEKINYRVVYSTTVGDFRTDKSFDDRRDDLHHLPEYRERGTYLEQKGFKSMVSKFVIEPMHLIDLGVTKKILIILYTNKSPLLHFSNEEKLELSAHLQSLAHYIPAEFARKPRSLDELKRWKAAEFRQFLLYTGCVVLKYTVNEDFYYHFLLLQSAIRLLSNNLSCQENSDCAEKMLQYFVSSFPDLYGTDKVSYNVHNLLHIANEVRNFGPIPSFSAYKFENYMQDILKSIKKGNKVLEQLYKRHCESLPVSCTKQKIIGFRKPIKESDSIYQQYQFETFLLTTKEPDNCCCIYHRDENIPALITSFIKSGDSGIIKCIRYIDSKEFFTAPVNSMRDLGIIQVSKLSTNEESFTLEEIKYKYVKLPLKEINSFILLPLLHNM